MSRGPLFPPYLPADPAAAQEADCQLSPYGWDCCEESRRLSYHSLRYGWLLGKCFGCRAKVGAETARDRPTLMAAGWSGPVKRPEPPGYDVEFWHEEE